MIRRSLTIFCAAAIVGALAGFMSKNGDRTIVCFGDSITHGARVQGHSWVYFLSRKHTGIDWVNEGRNGRKTSDKEELLPVLAKYKNAGTFLIFLGVNDLKDGNDSMVASCIGNMKWMIGKIRAGSPRSRIVILSPSAINVRTMSPLNVGKKYNTNTERSLVKLEKGYRKLAREESVGFISLLRVVPPSDYVDGLHPNCTGQHEIADAVWKGLERLKK